MFRAQRKSDQARVLIKLAHAPGTGVTASMDLVEWEFELTQSLTIDGILHAVELQSCSAGCALVLEDYGAAPLFSVVDRQPLELDAALEIALDVTRIIEQLHLQGVVHKAIRPHHIYVHPDSHRVWLTGFEVASRLPDDSSHVSQHSLPVEVLAYIAPEQTGRMNRRVGLQADLYSIGVLMYELLTGRLPFHENDPLQMIHAHIARVPESPTDLNPNVPRAVSNIVMKLLAKEAEDRYRSAAGLCADLAACLGGGLNPDFQPGRHDVLNRIRIPEKLYGRADELESLMSAFDRTAQGSTEILMVAGYSGVGKSALVHEVHKPIVHKRGYFASGKFDQFKRNIPYSAIISAFQELTRQILTESRDEIAAWRSDLLAAVGQNGRVIINVIPEIELIIGPQPPVPDLLPAETKNRFNLVFQSFIKVFARAQHPLVLFLDDLQWTDSATLELLRSIAEDHTLKYMLIIGAYRDNEVGADHPLEQTVKELESVDSNICRFKVQPLRINHLQQFVADTLHCPTNEAVALAKLVHEKTDGNPFFMIQFIKLMQAEQCLIFDRSDHFWRYDLEAIRRLGVTDNVVELMLRKIKKLPEPTQDAIKLAAYIGDTFDIDSLSVVSEISAQESATGLRAAIQEGLVLPLTPASIRHAEFGQSADLEEPKAVIYSFLHDRVQQAAYALIAESDRPGVHLRIGQLLLEHSDATTLDENIFEITGHLNAGATLLDDKSEIIRLIRLNLDAGRKAKSSTAYQPALNYFNAGASHVTAELWNTDYELAFSLFRERAETEYLCGNFDRAEQQLVDLLDLAKSPLDKAEIYRIRIVEYENTARFAEARDWGKTGLALFDIKFPESDSERQSYLDAEIDAIGMLVGDRPIESLVELPVMTNKAMRISMKLLMTMWAPSYISGDMVLTALIAAKMVHLSLRYGNIGESSYGYVTYGATIGLRIGDYKSSYEFGRLALAVNESLDDLSSRAKVNHMFSCYIGIWRNHISTCFPYSREAYRSGLASGDLIYAAYGVFHESWHALFQGQPLSEFHDHYAAYLEFMSNTKNKTFYDTHQLMVHWGLAFQGQTLNACSLTSDDFDEQEYLEAYEGIGFFHRFYHVIKTQLYYMFGRYDDALRSSIRAEALADKTEGMIWDAWGCFYHALTLAACGKPVDEDNRQRVRNELEDALRRFRIWAKNSPENFGHRCALLEAEVAAYDGDDGAAINAYETAIEEASRYDFLQIEALANECCARYWLGRDRQELAGVYLRAAERCYRDWGANAKVLDIQRRYPEQVASAELGPDKLEGLRSLDWATVVQAAQVISGEVEERQLLDKLLRIVLANAGAERGFIVLNHDGELTIEAEASVDHDDTKPGASRAVGENTEIARSVIRYVARVGDNVVLADATDDDRFSNDSYIQNRRPLSLLCTPILHKSKTIGLLYLENNLVRGAFTAERTEVVGMLAAQAAISIENARLYQDMKQEIDERKLIEGRLRRVAEATSPVTGSDYFGSLVQYLAEAFGVHYAIISRCTDATNTRVRTLAFWKGDEFGDNFEYSLAGTPCQKVICGEVVKHTEHVQMHFPDDADLRTIDAQSYLGIPLFDRDGRVIGHLAVIDDKPLPNRLSDVSILSIFAARAGAEIERNRAAESLQEAHDQLELRVHERTDELSKANRQLHLEIRQRASIEKKLQEAKDAAEASNLAKSRFLANMSHELRTPLNAILGYAQILERDKTLTEAQSHGIKTIERSGDHLLALIDDVLSLSKIEAGKLGITPTEFRFPGLLQSVLDFARLRAGQKGIEFKYRASRHLPISIYGDERALRQILLNLIGNAIKFTDQGTVTLEVLYRATREGAPSLRFVVKDTGIGMPSERIEEIFEPFQQLENADRADEGTGLGLAISRNLAELMGSHIEVDSTPGKGSVFSFELELPRQVETDIVTGERATVGYEGERRRVLVVDDSAENRSIILGLLEPLGFDIAEAENGRAAVEATLDWSPDVVLMDLIMPVMDGFEATRKIKQIPNVEAPVVIALSASVLESDQLRSADAGCDDFIPKPVRASLLLKKLSLHLGLSWICETVSEMDADAVAFQNLRAPSLTDIKSLQHFARMGDIQGVHHTLAAIANSDAELLPFVEEIKGKADRFELRRVTDFLDRYISQSEKTF